MTDVAARYVGQDIPMWIGNQPVFAKSGDLIDTTNPATGELLARIPDAGADDVDDAVAAAKAAFPDWSRGEGLHRAKALNALADAIEEHAEEFAQIDVIDNGSPIAEMRRDAGMASHYLRYFAGLILEIRGQTIPSSFDRLNYTLRQPFGVVGRLVPFNHPLMFAAAKIAAPLAAGNTVIVKPSEWTTLSALRMGELAAQIFPEGVVNVVSGYGRTSGDAIVAHPDIRRLAFTGSPQTGRALMARAAEVNVKSITLELGGKNPLVVFPDADLDKAVKAAQGGMNFTWQGQSCGSLSRLLVHDSIYSEFVEKLASNVDQLRSGNPSDPETQTGAIVNRPQLDKVLKYVKIGQDEGARLMVGGNQLTDGEFANGNFVRPAVFADVDPSSRLAQEEIFGPVLATMRFSDYDEALKIANGIQFGLTASVFTQNLALAHRFARDIEAGYIWVNEVSRHVHGTAFGGVKDSGLGREEDLDELLSYTQSKNVHVNFEG